MAHNAKIVTLDIETAPLAGWVWGTFKQFLSQEQIICDWSLLSYSAKWLHSKKLLYSDNRGKGASLVTQDTGVRDDVSLLMDLWKILDEADIVVMQNGVKFDKRKINARFLLLGMPPPSPYYVVDTMLVARSVAAFTSNRLAWLSAYLTDVPKDKHKEFPGFELWVECLKDNVRAWNCMRKYNRRDIVATEQVYLKLLPWIENHPNVSAYDDDTTVRCGRCGSTELVKDGWRRTNIGQYQKYKCTSCGGYARDRYTHNTIAKRRSLLTSI